MANRLNAKQAAALTADRAKEIEEQTKRMDLEKRLRTAQLKKQTRYWNTQANTIIEAALNCETSVKIRPALIYPSRLIENGFIITYVDATSFDEQQTRLRLEREEEEKDRRSKAGELNLIINRKIDEFVRLVKENDRYSGMTLTKENVVKQLLEKIQEYRSGIDFARPDRNQLFFHIFDSNLFLFKPINLLKPRTQTLQDALHAHKRLTRDLPDDEPDVEHESEGELTIPEEFHRRLNPKKLQELMSINNDSDFYLIGWSDVEHSEEWIFDELISAPAMAWLAGDYGQRMLGLIESRIRDAINSAKSMICLDATLESESWMCDLGDPIATPAPSPEHLTQILKAMKYTVKSKVIDQYSVSLDISW